MIIFVRDNNEPKINFSNIKIKGMEEFKQQLKTGRNLLITKYQNNKKSESDKFIVEEIEREIIWLRSYNDSNLLPFSLGWKWFFINYIPYVYVYGVNEVYFEIKFIEE